MRGKEAARHSGNCGRAKSGRLTSSIVSNHEACCIVAGCAGFTILMLAIPTLMAAAKSWGWW